MQLADEKPDNSKFPMTVYYPETLENVVVFKQSQLRRGTPFIVVKVNGK